LEVGKNPDRWRDQRRGPPQQKGRGKKFSKGTTRSDAEMKKLLAAAEKGLKLLNSHRIKKKEPNCEGDSAVDCNEGQALAKRARKWLGRWRGGGDGNGVASWASNGLSARREWRGKAITILQGGRVKFA